MGWRKYTTGTAAGSNNDNVLLYADSAKTKRIDAIRKDNNGLPGNFFDNDFYTSSLGVYPTFWVDEQYTTVYAYFASATTKTVQLSPVNEYYTKTEGDARYYTQTASDAKYEDVPDAEGDATLVAGTVTVTNANVLAASRIEFWRKTVGGTPGAIYVSAKTASTSFAITSTSNTDTSVIRWRAWW